MFNIIGKRFTFFLISGILILISVVSLATAGLKQGIEFSSGSMLSVKFDAKTDYAGLKQAVIGLGYTDAIVQSVGENEYLIRTKEMDEAEKAQLEADLASRFGGLSESQFYSVSPLVARETVRSTFIAVAVAMVGILLYVTWAFRRMPKAFRWGTCSIIALLHDAVVTVGFFSIFGAILGWEINLMFITGILTVIGYSVNNTIVVFDRIRENEIRGVSPSFETIANRSQVEIMGRSLNTSFTTLITSLALLLFVGTTIQNFAVVLIFGIVIGTFDSIFVAPGLLVVWDKNEWGRFIGRKPVPAVAAGGKPQQVMENKSR